ncbi:hypothetical protein U1Q18_018962 [Sarracenia purpurea var. burkii]
MLEVATAAVGLHDFGLHDLAAAAIGPLLLVRTLAYVGSCCCFWSSRSWFAQIAATSAGPHNLVAEVSSGSSLHLVCVDPAAALCSRSYPSATSAAALSRKFSLVFALLG